MVAFQNNTSLSYIMVVFQRICVLAKSGCIENNAMCLSKWLHRK